MRPRSILLGPLLGVAACSSAPPPPLEPMGRLPPGVTTAEPEWIPWSVRAGKPAPQDARERHLADVRQLTFEGENAEVSWSPDGHHLVWKSTRPASSTEAAASCDQTYEMDLGNGRVRRVSTGGGRTTGGFFTYPAGDRVIFASTLAQGEACPQRPDRSLGTVSALDPFQIYSARPDGSDRALLIGGHGYNAEATVSPDGTRLVFTSTRDGDLELYTARLDGSMVRRLTNATGYDGGARFSPDGSRLVWRASRPKDAEADEYHKLLARGLVEPTRSEIMRGGADGQNARAITRNGKMNLAPAFLPDGRRVIFASDAEASPWPPMNMGPSFNLYVVDPDAPPTMAGAPPMERITFDVGFDGSPVFSPDGTRLAFTSSRFGAHPGERNLFVARWVD